jgi:F-type H+-transporting ATPase subunit b
MNRFTHILFCMFSGLLFVFLTGHDAMAADNGSSWRGTYDLVMRWVNFGILVFLFLKFVKAPLMNFLKSRKEELAKDIGHLENEKEEAEDRFRGAREKIEAGEATITRIKDRIAEQGEKKREQIIEDARKQSRQMLEEAKNRAGSQILLAQEEFKSELVDTAITLALEKLPGIITEKDNQNLLDNYLAGGNK